MREKIFIRFILFIAFAGLVFALVSCDTSGSTGATYTVEFGGTWVYSPGTGVRSYAFTDTTCSQISTIPASSGTRSYDITSIDETLNHIAMQITDQTGALAVGTSVGDTLYFTYTINRIFCVF